MEKNISPLNFKHMIVNGFRDFWSYFPRDLVNNIRRDRTPIDFAKIDLKRPTQINAQILKLFDELINSPGMYDILLWYENQGSLLYLYKDMRTNILKFYGCNKQIEHHSSNIEYTIKFILQRILWDNGSKKTLVDRHSLALVGFGFLNLVREEVSGNIYQGHNTKYYCNVKSFKVCLSSEQVKLARIILRLIEMR